MGAREAPTAMNEKRNYKMKTFREYSKGNFYVVIQNKNEDLSKERYFYLRTGKSIEEIVSKSKKEFKKNLDYNFNSGSFKIEKNKIKIIPECSPPFTHLIAEGLFYNTFINREIKVSSKINHTNELFTSVNGFIDHLKHSEKSLTKILLDKDNPAIIKIPGSNPFNNDAWKLDYSHLARGFLKSRRVAMNYGYIFGFATFIIDGDESDSYSKWYILPNNPERIEIIKNRFNENARINEISKSKKWSFSEGDKVTSYFYFDGTLRNLINKLIGEGIELSKDLSLKDFSDK